MRKRLLAPGIFAATLVAGAFAGADATPPTTQLQYLVGTWNCSVSGSAAFSEHTTLAQAAGNPWVHGASSAQISGHPISEDFYVGYDARNSRWVLITIDSMGGYSVSTSSSPALNDSTWTAAYPQSSGSATFVENSATQYTLDSSGMADGRKVQTHEVCTRE